MAEMHVASDEVQIARKTVGPTTGLSTNEEMLLNYLKPHLSTMSSAAVQVVDRGAQKDKQRYRPHRKIR